MKLQAFQSKVVFKVQVFWLLLCSSLYFTLLLSCYDKVFFLLLLEASASSGGKEQGDCKSPEHYPRPRAAPGGLQRHPPHSEAVLSWTGHLMY